MTTGNHMTENEESYDVQRQEPKPIPYEQYIPSPIMELLTIQFEIPAEETEEIDFQGDYCGCDYCEKARRELTREEQKKAERPVRLSKGKTAFQFENKLIYCDCLEDYLKERQVLI